MLHYADPRSRLHNPAGVRPTSVRVRKSPSPRILLSATLATVPLPQATTPWIDGATLETAWIGSPFLEQIFPTLKGSENGIVNLDLSGFSLIWLTLCTAYDAFLRWCSKDTHTCSSLRLRSSVANLFPGFLSTMLREEQAQRAIEFGLFDGSTSDNQEGDAEKTTIYSVGAASTCLFRWYVWCTY